MPSADMTDKKSVLASTSENQAVSVEVGQILDGKYQVEKILGKGGMGVVVAAMHLQLREQVALKFLLPSEGRSEEFNARFLREAKISAKLRNEHVVKVSDMGVLDNGAPYMVMEYLEGEGLNRVLRREGPLPVVRALDYAIQACEGLAEAHALGVVHRDLKPSNLFVTKRRDGTDLLKVLDFGISKANLLDVAEMEDLTTAGTMMGSPRYMSPEQLTDTAHVDMRGDVWSLAVILYEMLTGAPPFVGETHALTCMRVLSPAPPEPIRDKRDDVSPALEQAILHALERNPSARTRDVDELAAELLDASRDIAPDSLWVALQRIHGTLHPDEPAKSGSYPGVASQRLGQTLTRMRAQHNSTPNSFVAGPAPASPLRNRGIILAAAVGVVAVVAGVLITVSRSHGPSPQGSAIQALSAPLPPSVSATAPQDASTPVATDKPPAESPTTPPEASSPAMPPAKNPPARWVGPQHAPPPQPAAPATSTAPTPPSTKRVDPLSERQ